MSLFLSLTENIKTAMKAGDTTRVAVLRMVKSAIHNEMISQKTKEETDDISFNILKREIKKRKESIESFKAGNRQDLVNKESNELKILLEYQPPQLSSGDLQKIIMDVVQKIPVEQRNFGKIMKLVIDKTQGKAGGKEIASLVKQTLAS